MDIYHAFNSFKISKKSKMVLKSAKKVVPTQNHFAQSDDDLARVFSGRFWLVKVLVVGLLVWGEINLWRNNSKGKERKASQNAGWNVGLAPPVGEYIYEDKIIMDGTHSSLSLFLSSFIGGKVSSTKDSGKQNSKNCCIEKDWI